MTKTTAAKTTRKSTKTVEKELTMNMSVAHTGEIDLGADDAILASMLEGIESGAEELTANDGLPGEDAGVIDLTDDAAIEAAIADIEKAEAVQDHYAAEEGASEVAAGDEPLVIAKTEKPKKEKKAKAPKEPKAPKPEAVRYNGHKTNAADVLKHRLGDKTSEMLVLEVEDASLDPAALAAKQSELLALLNSRPKTEGDGPKSQQKVAEKVVMLFGWLKNGGTLNKVMDITFRTLIADGEIQSGEKGNLWTALLAKPYSKGTANAQGGQMMSMLPMLKIATLSEKGKLVANPNSMILMAVKAQMGL